MYSTIGVIIPAYNELTNLRILVPKIASLYPGIKILVVDDSDTLQVGKLKGFITSQGLAVSVLSRAKKSGRGSAVRDGMAWHMGDNNIRYVIEMDADLAHKPEEIKNFLAKKDHADLIIGSRYLKKSHIIKWPVRRLIQSRMINFFLRFWLGLSISDFTNGFRLYSRRAVEILLKSELKEKGFIALSEMAYLLKRAGCIIKEIPTTFTDRTYGKSNADVKELLESLFGAIRIRFRHCIQM